MKRFNVCIVGGGSRYTPDMLAMLANQRDIFPIKKLILYDNDAGRQDVIGKYGDILVREYYPELESFQYTTDIDEAFLDIDFVLMQIRAGRLPMRELDEKIPLKYGCVGQETCGAGGFAYGMRSIPAIVEIIRKIRQYSPKAWILNYSNPAAIVAEATKRLFPSDFRIINICDMPIAIMDSYAKTLGITRQDIEPRYFGLNHFGWFTKILDKNTGRDLLPELRERIVEKPIEGGDHQNLDASWNATFEFMTTMANDFDEYLPNTYLQYYLYPKKMAEKTDPNYTRANEVMDGNEKRVYDMCRSVAKLGKIKGTEYELNKSNHVHASYIVELACALANNEKKVFLLMIENNGTIPNLSQGMMLEVPCIVGANGAEALTVGEVGSFYKGLLENQYAYESLTVDACLEGSYQKALQALVLNRTVTDTITAKKILDEFIEVNKGFWPELS